MVAVREILMESSGGEKGSDLIKVRTTVSWTSKKKDRLHPFMLSSTAYFPYSPAEP